MTIAYRRLFILKLRFADFHSDTLTECTKNDLDFFENNLQNDLKFYENFDKFFAVFAIFIPENLSGEQAWDYFKKNSEYFYAQAEKHKDKISVVKTYKDIEKSDGKICLSLGIENFSVADPFFVEKAYTDGVRFASLTWNSDNSLAGGAMGEKGLTDRGREVTRAMEENGIILDVSHLNRRSFEDVLEFSKKPLMATHSSSDYLCEHLRNLTDEQYLKITEKGGVVGVNFYREFLGGDFSYHEIARHIARFYSLNPEGVVFGSDFDGADMPDGLAGLCDMQKVFFDLEEAGIDSDILYRNAENFLKKMLK